MSVLNLHELYVVGQTAAYMSLDTIDEKVYTDKAEAQAAMEKYLVDSPQMTKSGFKHQVMSLDDYIRERGQERYYEGQANERDRNAE